MVEHFDRDEERSHRDALIKELNRIGEGIYVMVDILNEIREELELLRKQKKK